MSSAYCFYLQWVVLFLYSSQIRYFCECLRTLVNSTFKKLNTESKMSITNEIELIGIKKASEAVALTLKKMRNYAKPGMTTKELD